MKKLWGNDGVVGEYVGVLGWYFGEYLVFFWGYLGSASPCSSSIGVTVEELVEALALMQDIPFAVDLVEQGHAGGATLVRDHDYCAKTLAVRMSMQQIRALTTSSATDKQIQKLDEKLQQLEEYQWWKINGRHAYLSELVKTSQPSVVNDGKKKKEAAGEAMKQHADRHAALSDYRKHLYTQIGRKMQVERRKANEDAVAASEEEQKKLKQEHEQHIESVGILNHISAVKFTTEELADVCKRVESTEIQSMFLKDAEDISAAPEIPDDDEMDSIEQIERSMEKPRPDAPWWCRKIAGNRESWSRVAIHADEFGQSVWYLVLFCFEKPRAVTFLELRRRARTFTVGGSSSSDADAMHPRWRMEFDCVRPIRYHHSEDITISLDADIWIVENVHFDTSGAFTNSQQEPFEIFIRGQPVIRNTAASSSSRPRRPQKHDPAIKKLLEDNPWMSAEDLYPRKAYARKRQCIRVPKVKKRPRDGSNSGSDEPDVADEASSSSPGEEGKLDVKQAVIDGVGELARIRADDVYDWSDARFYRFIYRGGYWTAEHLHVGSNECGGVASNGLPKMWATRFQYAKQHMFSYAMYGGRANAIMLGREFVRRSEFFIKAYVEADDQISFRYTQAICDLYEDHQEFRDWMLALPITSAAFARGHALRHEFPLEPIDAVDTE